MKSLIFIMLIIYAIVGTTPRTWAGIATLSWDANAESDLAGYKIHYGTESGNYTEQIDVSLTSTPTAPEYTLSNLTDGVTYYFAVSAYDAANNESGLSNEVSKLIGTTGGINPGGNSLSAPGGGGCGMARNLSDPPDSKSGQIFMNLLVLAFLLSLGKIHVALKKRFHNLSILNHARGL